MSTHLFVLLHGVGGSRHDLAFLASQISSAFSDSYCHVVTTNEAKTTDGVDFGGSRAALEVMELLKTQSFKTLSVVGHSLGGLYGRYMVGILDQLGVFQKIQPLAFVSLAVPHLGARSMREQFKVGPAVDFVSRMIGRTTSQLMLLDRSPMRCGYHALIALDEDAAIPSPKGSVEPTSVGEDSVCICSGSAPLLVALAGGPFLRALASFQCRLAYANLCGDVPVGFETAAIQFTNPLLNLAPDYVIDLSFDFTPPPDPPRSVPETPFYFRFSREISKRLSRTQVSLPVVASVPAIDAVATSSSVPTTVMTIPPAESEKVERPTASELPSTTAHAFFPLPASRSDTSASEVHSTNLVTRASSRLGLSDAIVFASVSQIHRNLNTLHWHRVAIRGRPLLAHTDIVVKSETINAKGKQIVADLISKLDKELKKGQLSVCIHLPLEQKQT